MSGYSEFGAEATAAGLDVVPKPCTAAVLADAIRWAMTEIAPVSRDGQR